MPQTATIRCSRPLTVRVDRRTYTLGGDPIKVPLTDRARRDLASLAGSADVSVEYPEPPKGKDKDKPAADSIEKGDS